MKGRIADELKVNKVWQFVATAEDLAICGNKVFLTVTR